MTTADQVRASVDGMRAGVRETCEARSWTGPLADTVRVLAAVAEIDLCLARLVEGHVDAHRILAEAGVVPAEGVYGVWASRSAGTGARAVREAGGWHLTGQVRFASGVDVVDRVLLPGWVDDQTHLLFDIAAKDAQPDRTTWHTAAMDASRSFTVAVDATVDSFVGEENFYLRRPGFVVGGLGVAAVWAGGARSVTDQVATGLRAFQPTQHQLRRLGRMEHAAWQAATVVGHVAAHLDDLDRGTVERDVAAARAGVVGACERVLDDAAKVVGPGGLVGSARLARTLADLQLYVRQHNADHVWEAAGQHVLKSAELRP